MFTNASRILSVFLAGALFAAGAAALPGVAGDEARPEMAHLNLDDGLALEGYDPVAYFPEGGSKAARGKKEITTVYRGVTYRFASEAHRDLFLKSPAGYEPTYGGWCALAMAEGEKVEVDPESFLVENGKLRLFYKSFFTDTRKKWLADKEGKLAAGADREWKRIIDPGERRQAASQCSKRFK